MHQIRRFTRQNVHRMADNVDATLASASPDQWRDGALWYPRAHRIATDLAALGMLDVSQTAGIIAALSPQVAWARNVDEAFHLVMGEPVTGVFGVSKAKAQRILLGHDPDEVLKGNKVRAFYSNILDPDTSPAVTVDRHAFDVAAGRVTGDKERKMLERVGVYDIVADAYRVAADRYGIRPHEAQAVTWNVWRDRHASEHGRAARSGYRPTTSLGAMA